VTKTLDLGCGPNPNNPFNADEVYGVDIREDIGRNIASADLALQPIPWGDDMFEYVSAYQFIEHMPRVIYAPNHRLPFVQLMNEIYRVLKVGGIFLSVEPANPPNAAFQEPAPVSHLLLVPKRQPGGPVDPAAEPMRPGKYWVAVLCLLAAIATTRALIAPGC